MHPVIGKNPNAPLPRPRPGHPLVGAPPGRGAYGSVYRAVDRVSRKFVAIKIITLTDSDPQAGGGRRGVEEGGAR
jgi:hypothetical protein